MKKQIQERRVIVLANDESATLEMAAPSEFAKAVRWCLDESRRRARQGLSAIEFKIKPEEV